MANFYKTGAFATDTPSLIVLGSGISNNTHFSAFWKQGVPWTTGNQYQIPAGKKLSILAVQVSSPNTGFAYTFALGYADAPVLAGVGGTATAPVGGFTGVWGDIIGGTGIVAAGGFTGYIDSVGQSSHGTKTGPSSFELHEVFPIAAATKYPCVRFCSGINAHANLTLWCREV